MIYLIGNYLPDRQQSMLRFAKLLSDSLRQAGEPHCLIRPRAILARLAGRCDSGLGKWLAYLDKFVLFSVWLALFSRWLAFRGEPTIFHICDHSNALYTRWCSGLPVAVTCHDLLAIRSAQGEFPINPTKGPGRQLQAMIRRGLDRAYRVACVSTATLLDLLRLSKVPPSHAKVIPPALNYPYAPMPVEEARPLLGRLRVKHGWPPSLWERGFILHVGGNQWYKNRRGVLHIYIGLNPPVDQPPPFLIMAGQELPEELKSYIRDSALEDQVLRLVGPSNEELRALYSAATALLFPSLAEGFGWPIVEAQACGCPVVCSAGEPFLEVSGGAALLRDPGDEEGFREALAQVARPEERARLRQLGLANAQRYSSLAMAHAYQALYRELLPNA